jgi:ribonuclease T2
LRRPILVAMLFPLLLVAALGFSKHRSSRQASPGAPGVFDYYVLVLPWSPEFRYSHPDKAECSGHHGFVVHGLWPQYVDGYPECCSTAAGLANPSEVADIMPDAWLVDHEWITHGTCSGLDAEDYFQLLRRVFATIKVPERFVAPHENFSVAPQEVKRQFVRANPNFSSDGMTVGCGNNYLTAVSFCMTKELKPTACRDLRDCRANVIRVPRVQ